MDRKQKKYTKKVIELFIATNSSSMTLDYILENLDIEKNTVLCFAVTHNYYICDTKNILKKCPVSQ